MHPLSGSLEDHSTLPMKRAYDDPFNHRLQGGTRAFHRRFKKTVISKPVEPSTTNYSKEPNISALLDQLFEDKKGVIDEGGAGFDEFVTFLSTGIE